jgi:hypothetical protein
MASIKSHWLTKSLFSARAVVINVIFVCAFGSASAQLYNITAVGSTNWNNTAAWSTTSHLGASCACYPGDATHAGVAVNIGGAATITVNNITPPNSVASVTVSDDATAATLIIGNASNVAPSQLTITGALTINNLATVQVGGTAVSTNTLSAGSINVAGATGTLKLGNTGNSNDVVTVTGAVSNSGTFQTSGDGGGTFSLSVGGNLTNTGTVNLANTTDASTITINGSAAQTISGAGTTTFSSLIYSPGSTGALATATLTVSSAVGIKGDMTINVNGTSSLGAFTSSGTVTFSGLTTQTISGAGTISFTNLTLNNTGPANVNVNRSISINGAANALTFSANNLLVVNSSSNITMASGATISGAGTNAYIQLDGSSGANSNLISTGATWLATFPIGTSGVGYTPAAFTFNGTNPTAGATLSVKAIYNNSSQGHMRRVFRTVVTNNAAATTFTNAQFNYSSSASSPTDVSSGDAASNYTTIWFLSTSSGSWASVTGANNSAATPSNFTVTTATSLQSGAAATATNYYTIGQSTAYPNTWYSYQTGVWSNWLNWTSDPSGSTLVNALNLPPQPGDAIVILNGITITNDVSGQVTTTATINSGGTLDMSNTTGNTLGTVSGAGLLRIGGATASVMALPTGTYTSLVTAGTGGTIEYYNSTPGTYTLPTAQTTYNNIKLSTVTSAVTFVETNNLTVNGSFNITSTSTGTVTWQINDATATNRTITIAGDLIVSSNGKITAGTGNAASTTPHSLTLSGNFTNSGTVQFFDPLTTPFTSAYTSSTVLTSVLHGNAVSVTFSGSNDATATCNNQTDFYRFILNKGSGPQAMLTLNSSASTNMRLFGPANLSSTNNTSTGTSNCALSIVNGTLQLTGTLTIPTLIENDLGLAPPNDIFTIPQNGGLWLNSPNVIVTLTSNVQAPGNVNDDQRLAANGLFRVSNGATFNSGFSRGINSYSGGTVIIEGANTTVNIWQYRPISGGTGIFTYSQSGGTLNVGTTGYNGTVATAGPDDGGGGVTDQFARFSLANTNSSFQMSGGVINIGSPTTPTAAGANTPLAGGIDIQALAGNYSVTGGTINMYIPQNATPTAPSTNPSPASGSHNFSIYSTSPLYNVNIYREGTTNGRTAVLNGALTVLGNLAIVTGNTPTFSCGANNLTIGGNFDIQAGTTFTPSTTNTITFNGSGAQTVNYNGTITVNTLGTVVMNKSGGTLAFPSAASTGSFTAVTSSAIPTLTLTLGTLADGGKTLEVSTTLTNNAIHTSTGSGNIKFSGTNTIAGNNGTFGNLTITASGTVATSGNQTVTGNLSLTGTPTSILNISSNSLTVGGQIITPLTGVLPPNTSALAGLAGAYPRTYTNVAASSGGSGSGALFTVVVGSATSITSVTVTTAGSGYVVGDILTFNGTLFGGSGSATFNAAGNYIQTSGMHNAGGLTRPCVANTALTFPVGSGGLYTPNTINIPAASASTFGTITVRPVNSEHPNVTTTGIGVKYYWRVTSSGFVLNPSPTITHMNYIFSTAAKGTGMTGALSANTSGVSGMTPGTYTSVAASSGGSGAGALFTVVVGSATTITSVTVTAGGSGYIAGDILTFNGSLFGVGGSGSATFKALAANIASTGAYQAARYDRALNTWGTCNVSEAMTTTILGVASSTSFNTSNNWTPAMSDQLDGEYTCGSIGAFGSVKTYYSRASSNWNLNSTWSIIAVGGTSTNSNPTSCPTCPVIIGDGTPANSHFVTIPTGLSAATLANMCGSLTISSGSTLDCGTNATSATALSFGTSTGGSVSGTGTMRIAASTTTGFFPSGDFTNFIGASGGTVEYYGNSFTIPSTASTPSGSTINLTSYFNLVLNPIAGQTITLPANDLVIYNNVNLETDLTNTYRGFVTTNGARNISISGNLTVGNTSIPTSSVTLNISSGATALTVGGTTSVSSGATFKVTGGTNTFSTPGSIVNNGTVNFNNGGTLAATFTGSIDASFSGTGATTLATMIINKGSSSTPKLTFSVSGALTTTAAAAGWLTLSNGTFDYEYTGSSTTYPTGGATVSSLSTSSYTIPSTAKLKVGAGTIAITNASGGTNDFFLSGTLEVAGGTIYTRTTAANGSDNDIEYAAAGVPAIIVSSGSLSVDGSIRRSTSTLTGALSYNQTGGTVTVGGNNAATTRGVFEIDYNTGSNFSMAGNCTLAVQRPATGTGTYADIYLNPISSSVLAVGGFLPTITIGISATNNNFELNSATSLGNLTINSGANATGQNLTLYSNDLILTGTLTLNTNATLQTTSAANNYNVYIAGNLSGAGLYFGAANTTTFNGAAAQTANLTTGSTFNNLTISNSGGSGAAGTVTLSGTPPTSLNNLNILTGVLDVGAMTLPISGNITNNSKQISTGGAGVLAFASAATAHTITSSNGIFNNLALGVNAAIPVTKVISVSGNMTITGTLDFTTYGTSRYLFIGSSLLTFSNGVAPDPVSTATVFNQGNTRFIKTNGVSSDLGVARTFSTATTGFTYAVGTRTNYTPVQVSSFTVSTAGNLTVVPVDGVHPTSSPDGSSILDYYWKVIRDNSFVQTNNSGSVVFTVPTALIGGLGGTINGYYLDATNLVGWAQGSPNAPPVPPYSTDGTYAGGVFTLNSHLISGNPVVSPAIPPGCMPAPGSEFDYTFGTSSNMLNPIAPLYSRFGQTCCTPTTGADSAPGASWSAAGGTSWTTSSTGYGNSYGTVPSGRPMVILAAAFINLDVTGQTAFSTQILGTLTASTTGQSIGTISGTGTLKTTVNKLPAGTYTTFTSAAGGTIEYAAAVTMDGVTTNTYNNLKISSAGVVMTASNLTINSNLTITSGSSLDDSQSANSSQGGIALAGNFLNSGTFTGGTSTPISITGGLTNSGTFNASSSTVNLTGNLQNSGTFNGSSSTVNLTGNLQNTATFNGGSGTVNLLGNFSNSGTFSGGTGTVSFNGTTAQTITGATTFNNLTINNTFGTIPQVTVASGNQTVSSTFTNTSGLVNLNSTTLTIGTGCSPSTLTGAVSHSTLSSAGWVYGGNVTRYFSTSAIQDPDVSLAGSLPGFFPIGTATNFRPFTISIPGGGMTACGTFTLQSVGTSTASNAVSIPDLTNKTIVVEYQGAWTVLYSGITGGSYNITAGGSGFGTIGSLGDVTLCKATTTVGAGSYVLATLNSTSDPRMKRTGLLITDFDIASTGGNQFFVGSTDANNSPLPIQLLSFTGEPKKYGVDLLWKTASEINNDYFTVLRSSTGTNFESIGTVKGNGTTTSSHTYALTDYKPILGNNYYRLSQTDFDGRNTSSETIIVNVLSLEPLVSVYPNPLSQSQQLNVVINGLQVNSPTEIQIIDLEGTKVNGGTVNTDSDGSLKTSLSLTGLSSGLYFLKVQNVHYKFIIE